MTTEVELQQHFLPHTRLTEKPDVESQWNAGCTAPRIIATAPAIDQEADDNGNFKLSCSPPSPRPTTLFMPDDIVELHEEDQRCLAKFLSSGDQNELHISESNIHYYLQCANVLNHKPLEQLCENLLHNNKNTWENDRCFPKVSILNQDKRNSNNSSRIASCHVNGLAVPKFQILFLKQVNSEDHNKVLVLDVRRLNEDQKIMDVKKVARFEDGFACCTAYLKQCPYIYFSGRLGKKENSLIKYDVVGNKWVQCPDVKYARAKHVMAFANDCVFVIGGKKCSFVEKYDVANNWCHDIGSLPVGVHAAAHAVFQNKIYLFGGKNIRGSVSAVQCIDANTNKISRLPDLPFPCAGGQAIVVNDRIYFATNHGHMIKFDPFSGQSQLCSQQPYCRKLFVMFEKNDCLHLFGGVRTDGGKVENESTMFRYNPATDDWEMALSFKVPLPVQTSCSVVYPKECPVKPFTKLYGYC